MHLDKTKFEYYFFVWSLLPANKWTIPDFHWKIINLLDDYQNWNDRTAVMQVFRSAAKSTIVGVWAAWLLTHDPKIRIKIMSETTGVAAKMCSHIKTVLRDHPLSTNMLSNTLKSTATEFNVVGASHPRDSSVSCGGIQSNITGHRCDVLIFDDVESANNCLTDGLRESLNRGIAESLKLSDKPNDYTLYIGTPHSHTSIYSKLVDNNYTSLNIP